MIAMGIRAMGIWMLEAICPRRGTGYRMGTFLFLCFHLGELGYTLVYLGVGFGVRLLFLIAVYAITIIWYFSLFYLHAMK